MTELSGRLAGLSAEKRELLEALLRKKRAAAAAVAAIPPRGAAPGPFPLSFSQESLWLTQQLDPANPAYNIPFALRFAGVLDVAALAASLAAVVRRHEALRARFVVVDDRPLQQVEAPPAPALPVADLEGLPAELREAEARRWIEAETLRPFDLNDGPQYRPLYRNLLFRLSGEDHVLLTVLHHIVSDGWSTAVFARETGAFYAAARTGRPAALAPLPVQYVDFALWQRASLAGPALEKHLAFWRERLAGLDPVLELPSDRPRTSRRTPRGGFLPVALPAPLSRQVRELAGRENTTLFATLLAAFFALLYRQTCKEDLCVGSPVAGRRQVETEGLIGFFVNTLALRADLAGGPSFQAHLARVHEAVLDAQAHQDLPFERLVSELAPERSLSYTPIFQVAFTFQNAPVQALELPGIAVRGMGLPRRTTKFDLTLVLWDDGERIAGGLEHSLDLFDAPTVRRALGHLESLLAAAVADPALPLADLPLLGQAERHQLLAEWGGAAGEPAAAATLHGLFAERARRSPEAPAVTCGGETLSYGELNRRANRLAHRLRRLGVGPEDRVGLCLERSPDLLAGILGILKAGAAYVPLDPHYPRERLAFMAADAGIRAAVGTEETLAELADLPAAVRLDADRELLAAEPAEDPPPALDGAGLAYVIYTSGSTGRPKGALVSHGNVVRLFEATAAWFGFHERDVWTLFHSYAFDFSVWEIWGALLYGGRVVVVPHEVSRSPERFLDLLAGEGVTVLNQTPSAFAQLAQVDEADEVRGGVPASLRLVIFGGEALDLASLAPWFARHGDETPRLVNMYGITETTVHVTCRPLRAADTRGARRSVLGAPIPDLSLHVLDPWLRPAPIGVPGELIVGGAGLARGYLGRPELTAERFLPDPFGGSPGARLYRSGDLGRFLPDGDLEYLGRIDHQVKIRGFRIELGEIQDALEGHPGVRQAVVLAKEEPAGERRLVAFVVAQPEREVAIAELRATAAARLPDYMVPAGFVVLDSLPLTSNGKVDRKALLALLALAVPGRDEAVAYLPPRNATERALVDIWRQVLGVERVSVGDNFFSLGGDSILSLRVRSLSAAQGLPFELQDLFRYPTPAELAEILGGAAPEEEAAGAEPFALLSPEDRERLPQGVEDAYPPSLLQLGMLFHSEREPGSAVYHNVSRFRLRGALDPAAIASAVARLVARHPVLRTSFDSVRYGEPLQLVHREVSVPVEVADLRGLAAAERERLADERFEAEKRLRFDWNRPGLLRFWFLVLSDDTFELGLTEHHAILDGWSVSLLLSELFDLYGDHPTLPPPPAVFRDFIALERQALESEESRRFWSERLAGHTVLELPRWPGRAAAASPRRRRAAREFPSALSDALARTAEKLGTPFKSVLLAAHLRVLERLGGSADVLTGLVSHGRPETEGGDRALGLFLNTLPLRLCLEEGSWADLVRAAFRAESEMLSHRRLPLAELQRRASGGRPLFEVTFNYTHFHVLENAAGLEVLAADALAETNFPLTVQISRGLRGALRIDLQYDSAELAPAQVESYAELYQRALASLARDPGLPWAADPLLGAAQRHQLVAEWNDTRSALPRVCLHELVEARVDAAPDAIAVVAGGASLTYGELEARANRLAHHLRSLGVGPDVLVGICAERSLEMLVGMLGVLKAGGAYVPLDPDYPRERLAFLLEDAGVPVLLAQQCLAANLPSGTAHVVLLEEDVDLAASSARPVLNAGPDNLAYVIYTSGSTGRPKGVLVRHGGVVNRLLWAHGAYPVTPQDRVLQKASFSFDFSVWECFGPLIAGARVVLARPGEQRDPGSLVRTLREQEITMVHFIPSMLQAFVAEEGLEACTRLRYVFSGGEALSLELQERCLARVARVPAVLRNQYGPTEISIDTTDWVCGPEDSRLGFVPLGRPLSNAAVHVLDRRLDPALPGVPGELTVGGEGVARGYWRRPELTAEKFVPDPFSGVPGARLYRTGDRAVRLPDGNLRFLGRTDHQVKVRGYRIEPGEIEAALRAHPRVREAVVIARESAAGDRGLVAYVVGDPDVSGELRDFLLGSLPEHLVPAAFVLLPSLPLSPNGKLDRAALPEPGEAARGDREVLPPRDEVELRLARVWEDLLDVRPVGVRDDFFALGGHSLLALRLMGRIESAFGRRVPLAALVEASTVERMARLLQGEAASRRSLIVPLLPGGARPPLFVVHPVGGNVLCYLGLARSGGLAGPVYGIQAPGPEALAGAWTIEALAALYLEAMREIQPAGPWLLAGWSLGGVVAYEMARQLEAVEAVEPAGSEAALVAMIDVGPPRRSAAQGGAAESDLALFARDLLGLAGGPAGPLPEVPPALDDLFEREEIRAALPPGVGAEQARDLFAVFRANRRALEAYQPGPCGGCSLTLIRAAATATSVDIEGWRDLAGGAEVHILEGDHYSLLRPPWVQALAERLEACIAQALDQRGLAGANRPAGPSSG